MNTDTVLALVRAGHSDVTVARQLRMRTSRVSDNRKAAGLPAVKPGPKRVTAEQHFRQTAQPTGDGHLLWPQATPVIRPRGDRRKRSTPGQVAFRIGNGREPVGRVTTGCDHDGCIHPRHVEDQPMRDTYRAIFGKAAA
jgi:hypothetical protein